MSKNNCLLIKPMPGDQQFRNQQEVIQKVISPAIKEARLNPLGNPDGVFVTDISRELIRQICEADIVVVDANCYETTRPYTLSPFLYYCMAVSHSLGNRTILVVDTTSTDHLPDSLRRHHMLRYSRQDALDFVERFKRVVEEIQTGQSDSPDNPIQEYLKEVDAEPKVIEYEDRLRFVEERLGKLAHIKDELEEKEARLKALERRREELSRVEAELERKKAQVEAFEIGLSDESDRIHFRRMK